MNSSLDTITVSKWPPGWRTFRQGITPGSIQLGFAGHATGCGRACSPGDSGTVSMIAECGTPRDVAGLRFISEMNSLPIELKGY